MATRFIEQQGKSREPGGAAAQGAAQDSAGNTAAAMGGSKDVTIGQTASAPVSVRSTNAPHPNAGMQNTGMSGQTGPTGARVRAASSAPAQEQDEPQTERSRRGLDSGGAVEGGHQVLGVRWIDA